MGVYPYAYPYPYPYPYAYPYPYPPPVSKPSLKRWYGWQILAPTLALDATMLTAFFTTSTGSGTPGAVVAVSAFVGRGLTGPIVHLVHHHPLKALASFALEGVLPALFLAAAFAPRCNDSDGVCVGQLLALGAGLPIALTAGTAIDTAALSWEPRPPIQAQAPGPTWSLAPLALPALHAGSAHPGPVPAGAALVGTF